MLHPIDKFCITLREETEWVELVGKGVNVLTGAKKEKIIEAFTSNMKMQFQKSGSLYGNGDASHQICNVLLASLTEPVY